MEAIRERTVPWEDEMSRLWDTPAPAADEAPPAASDEFERPRAPRRRAQDTVPSSVPSWLLRLLLALALGLMLLVALITLADWGRVRLDDLRYGRPRTTHLTAFVGHHDGEGVPTHLIALNLNRRITIIEIPGGDPARMRTIAGPYLVGKDEELTVATMRLLDVNGDGHLDLLVRLKNEEVVYINEKSEFRLMTRTERPMVERALGGGK
jgi:hypothetical protein